MKKREIFTIGGMPAEDIASEFGTPLYVYDAETIRERIRNLRESIVWNDNKILYACKANTNLRILELMKDEGIGIDAVSPFEVELALKAGFAPEDITFTGNSVTDDEMRFVHERGVHINIDSLDQLDRYGKMFPGTAVLLRVNPDVGDGHHSHTITGGPDSKFGIYFDKVPEALDLAGKYDLNVIGLHQHIGSGILTTANFLKAMEVLFKVAKDVPGLKILDFGGGIGVPYRPDESQINLTDFGREISNRFANFCKSYGSNLKLALEPGRYLVCESGYLLTRVNTLKSTSAHDFVGTDTGFNHLVRPAMYGSYHEIVNASRPGAKKRAVIVSGNICESGDVFTLNNHSPEARAIADPRNGDLLAILNVGAYGFSMASEYNSRALPAEVLVEDGTARLIRTRGSFEDLFRNISQE